MKNLEQRALSIVEIMLAALMLQIISLHVLDCCYDLLKSNGFMLFIFGGYVVQAVWIIDLRITKDLLHKLWLQILN